MFPVLNMSTRAGRGNHVDAIDLVSLPHLTVARDCSCIPLFRIVKGDI